MSDHRLAYDDQDTLGAMTTDCLACSAQLRWEPRSIAPETAALEAPSLLFADFPREVHKPEISITDATAHLASRLHLHLD